MKYQVGDIVELEHKYGLSCCSEEYEVIQMEYDGLFYAVKMLCNCNSHGRITVNINEISGHTFEGWVRHVRTEHGLTA